MLRHTRWQTCRTVSSMSHMLAAHIASSISGSAASSSRARSAAALAAAAACKHMPDHPCCMESHDHVSMLSHALGNADTCSVQEPSPLGHAAFAGFATARISNIPRAFSRHAPANVP